MSFNLLKSPLKLRFWRNKATSFRRLQYNGTGEQTVYKVRKEPWINATILVVGFIPLFTFGLGTWQLKRLKWKVALIDDLEEKLHLPPLSLPKQINLSALPDFVYRKVFVNGKWDHAHTMLVGPRVRDGSHGVHVVTPLIRPDGSTVLVDRGFISNDLIESARHRGETGEVEVLGLIRTSQPRNNFTPDNDPAAGKWYWTDVDAMAEYAGGEKAGVQPVFLEQIFEGNAGQVVTKISNGDPVGRAASIDVRNSHMSYVITWYSLSAFTGAMFVRLLLDRRRKITKAMPR